LPLVRNLSSECSYTQTNPEMHFLFMALRRELDLSSSEVCPYPTGLAKRGRILMRKASWWYAVWLGIIVGFAMLHAVNLRADFPNHSPWSMDWAKYTDEGWYGDAAIRAHLFGSWYMPGDFNPAVVVPVWPFLEWVLFFLTGVRPEAARALAVAIFFVNLLLSYLLLRTSGSRSMALLALTLLVTNPFLYCFSRLAILEPLLTAFLLAALNVAARLKRVRYPVVAAGCVGLLLALAVMSKTTAIFLLPAVAWAMIVPLWTTPKRAVACALTAVGVLVAAGGLWMALIVRLGLLADFKYYFFVNSYRRPTELYWPLVSLWWSFHGVMWVDKILAPLSGLIVLAALIFPTMAWARGLLRDPVFGTSVLAILGCILFMTYQNHPQPRYFAVVAFFCCFLVAMGAEAWARPALGDAASGRFSLRSPGGLIMVLAILAGCLGGARTLRYASHSEYTFINAADQLAGYINMHPNGNRLLVSVSGDEITLLTRLSALCDDFGTMDLPEKLAAYKPGWYATWNDFDPDTLEDLHTRFSLEQVAEFPAFDDPDRNVLVLFKLHPLPGGQVRDPQKQDLKNPLPDDSIGIPME
jgi:Dolichyl-phosphate-mannose-protein mannosyltransferase